MNTSARRSRVTEATTVGPGVSVRGRILGDGDLTIEGAVDGEISIEGALQVAAGAQVRAQVQAESVWIGGSLQGNITAGGMVKVASGGTLRGDVTAGGFAMEDGAQVAANILCDFDLPAELRKP